MSMSNERLEQIRKTWEARRAFEWVGTSLPMDSTHPEVVDVLDLLDEVARLREALMITDEMVERAALAKIDEERWPTNEELGGSLTGTRDDEFRDSQKDDTRRILEAALEPVYRNQRSHQ